MTDILVRLDATKYGDRGLRLLLEGAAKEIRALRARVAELALKSDESTKGWGDCVELTKKMSIQMRDDREAFIRMGELLKTGGMTDPWFLLGQVQALKDALQG